MYFIFIEEIDTFAAKPNFEDMVLSGHLEK